MTASSFILLPALMQAVQAFVPLQTRTTVAGFVTKPITIITAPRPPVALDAKSAAAKKKNKKSSSPNKGGGFGSAPSAVPPRKRPNKSKGDDADIAYPDLDPQVVQTLVPSPVDGANEGLGGVVLSEEMYDRLEEIYGQEKFNFGGEGAIYKSIGVADGASAADSDGGAEGEEDSGSPSLFDDILSGGGGTKQGNNALDDLFSPTTSSVPISLADVMEPNPQDSSSSATFDLNSIPPFQKFRVLHTDPMVLAIDDFFTVEECDRYIQVSIDSENNPRGGGEADERNLQPMLLGQSQTVGKDSRSKAQRTSTTWFHHYEGVPELMAKASRLLGLGGIGRWEEPQTVRYRRNEKFTWHLDALSPEEATDASGAGQRVATLLVYLTDLAKGDGGATMFRDLGGEDGPLKVRPKKGSALLFFPAAGGIPDAPFDIRTLHCGEVVSEDAASEKWIAQLWLRQREYKPTAPAGNEHQNAFDAIGKYCDLAKV